MTDRTTTKVKGELYVRLQDVEPAMAKATAAFEAEVDRLTKENEGLGSQLLDVQQDCIKLRTENEKLRRRNAWLRGQLDQLTGKENRDEP